MKKLLGIVVLGLLRYDVNMKKFFRLALLILALINLNACMTTQEAAVHFDKQTPKELCTDFMSLPDYNIWYEDRKASIIRRNIDCSPYAADAHRRAKLLNALEAGAYALSQPTSTTSTGYSTSTGFTKVCYYDGIGGPSALTISSTGICPLSYSHNITGFTKICHYPNEMGGPKALTISSTGICPISYPR